MRRRRDALSDLSSNRPIERGTRARRVVESTVRTPQRLVMHKRSVRWSSVLTSDVPAKPKTLNVRRLKSVLKKTTTPVTSSTYFLNNLTPKRHRFVSTKENMRMRWHSNALRCCEIYIRKLPDAVDVFSRKVLKGRRNHNHYFNPQWCHRKYY